MARLWRKLVTWIHRKWFMSEWEREAEHVETCWKHHLERCAEYGVTLDAESFRMINEARQDVRDLRAVESGSRVADLPKREGIPVLNKPCDMQALIAQAGDEPIRFSIGPNYWQKWDEARESECARFGHKDGTGNGGHCRCCGKMLTTNDRMRGVSV